MDTSGESIQLNPVKWSDLPGSIAWDDPYLLGIVHDTLEIYTLKSCMHMQTLPDLNTARLISRCKQGKVYVASMSQVWCISATHFAQQIRIILEQSHFQLALKVTNLFDLSAEEKTKRTCKIQTLSESTKATGPRIRKKKLGLLTLIDYLTEVRYKLMNDSQVKEKNLNQKSQVKSVAQSDQLKNMTAVAVERLLKIIDTNLLQCYLQTNDALVAPLLRLNHCHLAEAEKTLLQHQKYPELIILYQTKGQCKKALELLEKQSKEIDSSLKGPERTIQYLQHHGKDHMDLILKFAGWVLDQDPGQGLPIFMEDVQEVEQLPTPKVLTIF
ncbi:hypothetical protein QAD02_002964 [Eretmocerus hayati]|uniref:Uncharacterized protein n=2 Tax=Eretmocerus hayati TaxID=131215 RepID=A0ACC2NQ90_9HYME|nr:hypothetical protein QAD02_002959 [Eretmocerus hayati]KAJ8671705.1 hypothetical protein QAD02_002964 [Eretmocerus hayati]